MSETLTRGAMIELCRDQWGKPNGGLEMAESQFLQRLLKSHDFSYAKLSRLEEPGYELGRSASTIALLSSSPSPSDSASSSKR